MGDEQAMRTPRLPVALDIDPVGCRIVLDHLPLGVAYYNRDLVFEYVNPAYAAWVGRAADDILGRRFVDVFPGTEDTMGVVLAEVVRTGQPYHSNRFCFIYRSAQGPDQSYWDVRHIPRLDSRGETVGVVTIASDMAPMMDLEQEIVARAARLEESESRFRAMVEEAPLGIAMVGLDGRIRQTNRALQAMLGLGAEALAGRAFEEIVRPGTLGRRQLGQLARNTLAEPIEVCFEGEQGHTVWGRLSASLNRDLKGAPRFITVMIDDITDLKHLEEVLRAQFEQLKELDRLKGDFVNSVSHELRTPLTTIQGYVEFLQDEVAGGLSPEQRQFVEQIGTSAQRLNALVNDLLDAARLDAGTFRLDLSEADLGELIRAVVSSLRPQAHDAQVELAVELAPGPLSLTMDRRRIEQVLINLIGNAIKFAKSGTTARIRARRDGEVIRCEVVDQGPGIPEPQLCQLFQRFGQLEAGRRKRGTGLGLSISKAIVESHGGRIGVESAPRVGSTFWFTLPASQGLG